MTYERPQITDLGNVRELTAGSAFQNITPANNGKGNGWGRNNGGGSASSGSGASGVIGTTHS